MCTAVFTISRGSEGWTLHLPVVYSKAYQRIPVYNGLEATLIQDAVHHALLGELDWLGTLAD